jgi:hypothetical protein
MASKPNKAESETYSKEGVLGLSRTSYQKGCVDGMNYKYPLKTYGKNFEACLKMAQKHESEIREILE